MARLARRRIVPSAKPFAWGSCPSVVVRRTNLLRKRFSAATTELSVTDEPVNGGDAVEVLEVADGGADGVVDLLDFTCGSSRLRE